MVKRTGNAKFFSDALKTGHTSHPDVTAAEEMSGEVLARLDGELGSGLTAPAKLTGKIAHGESDTKTSRNWQTGLRGGKEVPPGPVDNGPAACEERHQEGLKPSHLKPVPRSQSPSR